MKKMNSKSLWAHAWDSLKSEKMAMVSLIIISVYFVVAFLSFTGVIADGWTNEIGPSYAAPSSKYIFGLDIFGRSVFDKMLKGTEIAVSVGLITCLISSIIGVTLGAIAGYFGGKIDEFLIWFYTVFTSIPYILLLVAFAWVLGKGMLTVYVSLALTGWTGLFRLIRGEFIRHKDREYVHAATAIGASHQKKIFKHILPNTLHIVIINFSLQFQTAIKSEVILSYLGLGVQGNPSWGVMINDSKLELARGYWWQLAAATVAMMIIVLAFNILSDALRDALDPKLKGK
jgi:peptide/nickel transport system permease protein